jgi:hypothetical protein
MEGIAKFRSADMAHGVHAVVDGTNFSGGWPVGQTAKCPRQNHSGKSSAGPKKKDMRQGIARARRHVAPARLLC